MEIAVIALAYAVIGYGIAIARIREVPDGERAFLCHAFGRTHVALSAVVAMTLYAMAWPFRDLWEG